MMGEAMPATRDGTELFRRNVSRVVDGVRAGLFAEALEAACRLVVNESKRHDRALAWNDVTGNLRASISFQVEGRTKPQWIASRAVAGPDAGRIYNTEAYVSGENTRDGEYGIVYAPPEYAVHVEMKSSRSVLLDPLVTVQAALTTEMGREAKKSWEKFLDKEIVVEKRPSVGSTLL